MEPRARKKGGRGTAHLSFSDGRDAPVTAPRCLGSRRTFPATLLRARHTRDRPTRDPPHEAQRTARRGWHTVIAEPEVFTVAPQQRRSIRTLRERMRLRTAQRKRATEPFRARSLRRNPPPTQLPWPPPCPDDSPNARSLSMFLITEDLIVLQWPGSLGRVLPRYSFASTSTDYVSLTSIAGLPSRRDSVLLLRARTI
jgi:hypothetical protein